ncbi:unnamed protein product [Didymodactylos carnosus]|uniref:Uncharacterized protein n=1 Tax=Didymodactylos carnosus TaxID=1234261 RepID=A0A815LWM5_9BILA|nr:unnamed protein product [Didymodactylos carnosus]CAF1411393.1 unnamed protein product [Didymodactylos carnosus]CAF4023440.1 unnamed protein product [Didymodactylos carnosus]CAF4299802.1 unnamed protein product [Didymodactylos carnosus]
MAKSGAKRTKKSREKLEKDKVSSSLPKCDKKKKVLVQHLAQTFGLLPKTTHHRVSVQLPKKLKNAIFKFYIRDDVSYQCPGKRDTIVMKEDNGQKTTHHKTILLNNIRENYELFKEENKNVNVGPSAFANLRPPFVIPKAALAHRSYIRSKSEGFSFALPSSDISHDKYVVNSALELILNHIKTILPNLKEVSFFNEGAASQFKQRFHFRNLIRLSSEYKIRTSWHFFATSHGKGVVDGIGGSIKRVDWSAVLGGDVCRWAPDFLKIAAENNQNNHFNGNHQK